MSTNSPQRVLVASLIGTTIEFFDFYIYATAAVLVFPKLFFPSTDPASATLASFATFGIAFLARPVGSALFGHFGDRIGRKATLVMALLTMGVSTIVIGILPTYHSIGIAAPLLLALCRFGQGVGLGGEWSGAVLLAVENAPPNKRAWYGMYPQLGAPIGFFLSGGVFLLLSDFLSDEQFLSFGWRIPFLASAILVFVGLYIRLSLNETPVFLETLQRQEKLRLPFSVAFKNHKKAMFTGMLISIGAFILFYLMSVFALSYGTTTLGYKRETMLLMQLGSILFFAATIPIAAILAKESTRQVLLWSTVAIAIFAFCFAPLFESGPTGAFIMMIIGMSLVGFTYGLLGTTLSELFPPNVRYTGSSIAFSMSGILGASLAPYIATWLAKDFGLAFVGYYLAAASILSLTGILRLEESHPTGS